MLGILAGFDALAISLGFAVALLVTASIIRPLLVSVLSSAPFVGGWLASNVDGGLARFQASLMGPANAALGVLVSTFNWLETQGRGLVSVLVELETAAYQGISDIRALDIPHAITTALTQAEALVNSARAAALLGIQQATDGLRGAIDQAASEGAALVTAARGEAQGLFSAAEAEAVTLEGQAESMAHSLFLQAQADAATLAGKAEATAQQLSAAEHTFAAGVLVTLTTDLQRVEAAAHVAISDTAAILGGDIAEAEKRAGNVAAQLAAQPAEAVKTIQSSTEWALLQALVGNGESLIGTAAGDIAAETIKWARSQAADLPTWRKSAGPAIEAAYQAVLKGLQSGA